MITFGEQTISAFIFYGMTRDDRKFSLAYGLWSQGMLELCGEAVSYATLMQKLYEHCAETLDVPGVYDYEVAEVFGKWFRDRVIAENGDAPIQAECVAEIRKLVTAFFSCKGEIYPQDEVEEVVSDFFKGRSE